MNPEQTCCKPRRGLIRTIFDLAVVYVLLVGGAGTLINTGHPIASQVGHIIQDITFVRPTIAWANDRGHDRLATGLRVISNGVPMRFVS